EHERPHAAVLRLAGALDLERAREPGRLPRAAEPRAREVLADEPALARLVMRVAALRGDRRAERCRRRRLQLGAEDVRARPRRPPARVACVVADTGAERNAERHAAPGRHVAVPRPYAILDGRRVARRVPAVALGAERWREPRAAPAQLAVRARPAAVR